MELDCSGKVPSPRFNHSVALVNDIMYILGGRTINGDYLSDLAALHITSKRWLILPTTWPAPSHSVYSMTAFRQQIFVLAGATSRAPKASEVYVLDTTQIRWPLGTWLKDMGEEAFISPPSDSAYGSMDRTMTMNEQEGSNESTKTVRTYNLDLTLVKVKLISAFASELCQSLRDVLGDQQDIVKTVTQILPGLLEDYSIKLSHGGKKGLQKDAAGFVRQYRQYVTSTASLPRYGIFRYFFPVLSPI
jgi:Galactose oxidase, central domain